ncbi:hypothetical protein EJB05_22246 [Eragrostis curvula]|uniref:NAD(P)H dehydrogenase (quinone) n=1 Tax=Eragrostis curvula TaxID=38414 RepID=A0A5J9V3Y5_9POAL|nr:hypothetical protein EJB05_22246 [Eragrostis curvula]
MGKGGGCVPSKKRQPPAGAAGAPSSSSGSAAAAAAAAATAPREAPEEELAAAAGRSLRLYIVFYSMYGHVETLAQRAAVGAGTVEGVEAVLRRVPETLPPEVLEKMQAPAKDPAVPVIESAAELEEADGVLFGFPTRYGAMAAQMKAFFDSTGSLWEEQKLAGKPAGFFVSTGTQGGGQETTAFVSELVLTTRRGYFTTYSISELEYLVRDERGMFKMDDIRGGSPYGAGVFAGDGSRQPSETELALAEHQGKRQPLQKFEIALGAAATQEKPLPAAEPERVAAAFVRPAPPPRRGFRPRSAGLNRASIRNTEVMGDSVAPVCVNVIPDAADAAFQIHQLKRSAYASVQRSFCAQSDLLSGAKEECLAQLRKEFNIPETEHGNYLVKARSNMDMKSLSAGSSKGSTCNTKIMKDTPDVACAIPHRDTVFQIHCLQRSAYASVLRAFCAVTNRLSWVKLLAKLRNELRILHIEHKEVLVRVISDERNLVSQIILSMKMDAAFHAQAVVCDKIASTGQLSTSSTSCLSSMSSVRNNGILDISAGAKEGSCFEPHAVVPAKRLKSVRGASLAYLECPPSVKRLTVAVSTVTVKGSTDDTLDREAFSCEMKAVCAISPIFQEQHSQSNSGQFPSCVDHVRQESRKRKTEVPVMRGSKSVCVVDRKYGIYYQRRTNKDSNLGHGSEIFKICLTANLLNKVEKLFKENPDPANLETAKTMLKAHEKDLLDALAKLSEVLIDVAYVTTNAQLANNNHDELPPKSASSIDETPTETPSSPSANSTGIMPLLQAPPHMQTLTHSSVSPPSASAVLTESSSTESELRSVPAPTSTPTDDGEMRKTTTGNSNHNTGRAVRARKANSLYPPTLFAKWG